MRAQKQTAHGIEPLVYRAEKTVHGNEGTVQGDGETARGTA